MNRKTSAVDLTDLAIGILILGIVVTIGARILIGMRDARLTDLPQLTTGNESIVISNASNSLTNTWVSSVTECLSNVTGTGNQTVNSTIVASNYSISISDVDGTALITNTTNVIFSDAACSYNTYDITEPDWALANDAAVGIAEYGNWFDIIVIIGIAGVILALIFMAFGQRGGQGGSVSY